MKKLLTLLFTLALAFSLAMPVFAQDAGSQDQSTSTTKPEKHEKKMKKHHMKKEKKMKKEKMEKKADEGTPQQ